MCGEATRLVGVQGVDWESFATRAAPEVVLPEASTDDEPL